MPMDPDWKVWHQNPRKPQYQPPEGAVDAHCHVFGPEEVFPYAPERKYTPCTGSKEQLFALRDHLGFSRNVIVQASCHGRNNDALIDALKASDDMARGIAVVDDQISADELAEMHAAGVRGVRFNFVRRLVDPKPRDHYERIIDKIAPLGWHIIVYIEAADFAEQVPFLKSLPVTVVFDHMARPDVAKGVDHPDFQAFVDLMESDQFWCKVSCPERLTQHGGSHENYSDVLPFMKRLVDLYPDRVLWGTDWPHPNMKSHVPDDGQLVELIPLIADTEEKQRKLLVDNPMRLYWG
ncbi:2-pyrone-4,6-dicarboxylic acid hydrolase [Candidatus Rhodobacter oscarellae]|uniref:2-pyrone-4,6-dicarboxylic acid hydrolase n=1 Tax=Candidatus Rhodobacter oscarellae TaxID=1675527 RepID=A0A0J9E4Z3_9RHOB|nr:amidohydrolase family protein [Candidatus Rhodobacter lobularis]KMW57811.1 2-pyrone-4,6-dicarboxylic acid hydrolase [Candidatus Rhodobacter lobularis]